MTRCLGCGRVVRTARLRWWPAHELLELTDADYDGMAWEGRDRLGSHHSEGKPRMLPALVA